VNILVCRLAKVDYGMKNVFPLLNQFKDTIKKESVTKIGLDVAFSEPINLEDLNSVTANLKYILYKVNLDDSLAETKIEDIELPDTIIPIIFIREKDKTPQLCRTNQIINKGDELIIFVYENMKHDIGEYGFYNREVMKL
jgi:NhaP-type Na+/H+ and K+/H+ antiporter